MAALLTLSMFTEIESWERQQKPLGLPWQSYQISRWGNEMSWNEKHEFFSSISLSHTHSLLLELWLFSSFQSIMVWLATQSRVFRPWFAKCKHHRVSFLFHHLNRFVFLFLEMLRVCTREKDYRTTSTQPSVFCWFARQFQGSRKWLCISKTETAWSGEERLFIDCSNKMSNLYPSSSIIHHPIDDGMVSHTLKWESHAQFLDALGKSIPSNLNSRSWKVIQERECVAMIS